MIGCVSDELLDRTVPEQKGKPHPAQKRKMKITKKRSLDHAPWFVRLYGACRHKMEQVNEEEDYIAMSNNTYHSPGGRAAAKVDDSTGFLREGHMKILAAKYHLEDVMLQMQPIMHME